MVRSGAAPTGEAQQNKLLNFAQGAKKVRKK